MALRIITFLLSTFLVTSNCIVHQININSTHLGRRFDGIGAISGGGATSKLLVNYNRSIQSEILDYLFKPGYGAALHMLKVEMGGDAQTTEGTEGSHMHTPWDENYNRGYEWWMMTEAKKRNPNITLLGLPWAFPAWVGEGSGSPYTNPVKTATYVTKWILGAKKYHNLTIDYMGIWNEKPYDINYVKTLRNVLNSNGLSNVKLVVGDGTWSPGTDAIKDPSFSKAFDVIGAHYPGTESSEDAKRSRKALWSSEDYSTLSSDVGSGCWARIINQNYVSGLMTSTIAWNLITSYYDQLPYPRASLMTANQPWSGHFEIAGPLWVTAHTTHFTQPGWIYLAHGNGVGKLPKGGSYVSLISPDRKSLTIVIETMTYKESICVRPYLQPFMVEEQTVSINLSGFSESVSSMRFYLSNVSSSGKSEYFKRQNDIMVTNNQILLTLKPNSLITLTTLPANNPSTFPQPSPSSSFPLPYSENFESYSLNAEPYYITPQVGYFEIVSNPQKNTQKCLAQVVPEIPIHWCPIILSAPFAVVGPGDWETINASLSIFMPTVNSSTGSFLATRVDQGGCTSFMTKGIFVWLLTSENQIAVTNDLMRTMLIFSKPLNIIKDRFYRLNILDKGSIIDISLDGKLITSIRATSNTPKKGFVAMGTDNFGSAFYDDLLITRVNSVKPDTVLRFNPVFPNLL